MAKRHWPFLNDCGSENLVDVIGAADGSQAVDAYFLSRLLVVIVPLYPDPHHARLVHDLLDHLTVFANHLACGRTKQIYVLGRAEPQHTRCTFLTVWLGMGGAIKIHC